VALTFELSKASLTTTFKELQQDIVSNVSSRSTVGHSKVSLQLLEYNWHRQQPERPRLAAHSTAIKTLCAVVGHYLLVPGQVLKSERTRHMFYIIKISLSAKRSKKSRWQCLKSWTTSLFDTTAEGDYWSCIQSRALSRDVAPQ